MDPFWKTFYEELKDRGRDGTPFIITLGAMVGLLIGAAIVEANGALEHIGKGLPWAGTIAGAGALLWAIVAIRRARTRQRERWERRELSCDEWRVARSKLKRDGNRKGA